MQKMKTPVVSLIIPTYNRSELLNYTLLSIVNQRVDRSIVEVLVVDDGSSDDTPEVVNGYKNKLNIKYFFQPDQGYRPGSARNVGILNATGEICVFIDSGMLVSTHFVAEHVAMHAAQSEPVSVIGYIYGFDNNTVIDRLDLINAIDVTNPDQAIAGFKMRNRYLDPRDRFYVSYNDDLSSLPAPWVFYWSGNISARRTSLLEAGIFDAGYDGSYGMEDLDLGYRLYKNKVKIVLSRNADAIHYPHSRDIACNVSENEINMDYFHRKYNTEETQLFLKHVWALNDVLMQGEPYAKAGQSAP